MFVSQKKCNQLFDAIISGDLNAVQEADLKTFQTFEKRDSNGNAIKNMSALFYSILYRKDQVFSFLIEKKVPMTLKKDTVIEVPLFGKIAQVLISSQCTVLQFAVIVDNSYAVQQLLQRMPEMADIRNANGQAILQTAGSMDTEAAQIIWKNSDIVKRQIMQIDQDDLNPLMRVCYFGRARILKHWMLELSGDKDLQAAVFKAAVFMCEKKYSIVELATRRPNGYDKKGVEDG